ncbi:MAG TPA: TIR domain-containing protein [Mycobacteriales bacterium]|nr:TIR domain-containing protein [Mycobacteriales bacterium]
MTIAAEADELPRRPAGRRLLGSLRAAHDAETGLAAVTAVSRAGGIHAVRPAVRTLLDTLRAAHRVDAGLVAVGLPPGRNPGRPDPGRHRDWRSAPVRLVPDRRRPGRPVRVFLSYCHAPADHAAAVNQLAALLRRHGIDSRIDTRDAVRPRDWTLWTLEQDREADYVLVVASAEYRRRAEGLAGPGEGRGVAFEAGLIREAIYANPIAAKLKYLSVLLPGTDLRDIPAFLGPTSGTRYLIPELSSAGIAPLLRVLNPPRGSARSAGAGAADQGGGRPGWPAGVLDVYSEDGD